MAHRISVILFAVGMFAGLAYAEPEVSVSDLAIPAELGYMTETHPPAPGSGIIVHIQEAHTNYEAQQHLVGILEQLVERHGLQLILVEGGAGDVGLSYLRRYGPPDNRRAVAEKYLKAGIISGEEYLDIVSEHPLVLWGIEQESLYQDNLEALTQTETLRESLTPILASVRQATESLRPVLFSDELKELEAKAAVFRRQQLGLGEYVDALVHLARRNDLVLDDTYLNLRAFHAARELEDTIRLDRVQPEQQALIKQLGGVADAKGLEELIAQAEALKQGTISREMFYTSLQRLAETARVSLEPYPNLTRYIHYVKATAQMKPTQLAKEVDAFADRLRRRLAATPDSRQLLTIVRQLDLMEKLLAIRLSPQEYQEVKEWDAEPVFAAWTTFFADQLPKHGLANDAVGPLHQLSAGLSQVRRFYEVAQQRDQALVDNALAKLSETKEPLAVLITGGFHSPEVTRLLKEQGLGVVVVAPKISQPTNEQLYHAVLRYKNGEGRLEDVLTIADQS